MEIVIDHPIVSVSVETPEIRPAEKPVNRHNRPPMLIGQTYKIKPGTIDDAIYITLNHWDDRMHEAFISTNNVELGFSLSKDARWMSAIWRREKNATFFLEDWNKLAHPTHQYPANRRMYRSIEAHISEIIEAHMLENGFINEPVPTEPEHCIDCES